MKTWLIILGVASFFATAASGAEDSSLPAWSEAERASGFVDGALLRADPERGVAERLDLAPPTAEDLSVNENPSLLLPEKFWSAYFGERPRKFLIDPQGLLSGNDLRDRLSFLDYHAGDSAIDLFVYVLKGDQEIPAALRLEEVPERLFSTGRPAVIVYYYMGAPRRTALYLSPALTTAVTVSEQRRALESSIMRAVAKEKPSSQLEAFLVQMSIRIYWMERLWDGGTAPAKSTTADERPPKKPDKKAELLAKLQPLIEKARRFALPAGALAGALVIGGLIWAWIRMRARYRFPVWNVEPRLGGDHAAGVGAVISFASATVSLASQREQRADDARWR